MTIWNTILCFWSQSVSICVALFLFKLGLNDLYDYAFIYVYMFILAMLSLISIACIEFRSDTPSILPYNFVQAIVVKNIKQVCRENIFHINTLTIFNATIFRELLHICDNLCCIRSHKVLLLQLMWFVFYYRKENRCRIPNYLVLFLGFYWIHTSNSRGYFFIKKKKKTLLVTLYIDNLCNHISK